MWFGEEVPNECPVPWHPAAAATFSCDTRRRSPDQLSVHYNQPRRESLSCLAGRFFETITMRCRDVETAAMAAGIDAARPCGFGERIESSSEAGWVTFRSHRP